MFRMGKEAAAGPRALPAVGRRPDSAWAGGPEKFPGDLFAESGITTFPGKIKRAEPFPEHRPGFLRRRPFGRSSPFETASGAWPHSPGFREGSGFRRKKTVIGLGGG
jgi:hypothetical protein